MSMDQQVVNLIRDQFKALSDKVDTVHNVVREHVEEDQKYWAMIEQQRGQMSLLKAIFGASGFSALVAWIYNSLKH